MAEHEGLGARRRDKERVLNTDSITRETQA